MKRGLASPITIYANKAINVRMFGCFSITQTNAHARSARSRPIIGVALARNLASIAALLIGLLVVPLPLQPNILSDDNRETSATHIQGAVISNAGLTRATIIGSAERE